MNESKKILTSEETRAFKSYFARGCELAQSPFTANEAVWHLKYAQNLNPDDARTHFELGRVLHLMGRCDEADKPLKESVKLSPSVSNLMLYGLNCNRIGLYGEAAPTFRRILE